MSRWLEVGIGLPKAGTAPHLNPPSPKPPSNHPDIIRPEDTTHYQWDLLGSGRYQPQQQVVEVFGVGVDVVVAVAVVVDAVVVVVVVVVVAFWVM
jgi:hypothetical protein